MIEKKIKRVIVSLPLLLELVTEENSLCAVKVVKGVPEDAIFTGSCFDSSRNEAFLFFAHPDFEGVAEGCEIPVLEIKHEKL